MIHRICRLLAIIVPAALLVLPMRPMCRQWGAGCACVHAPTHTHIPVRPAGTAWPVAARPHHRKRHAVLPLSLQPAKRIVSVSWAGGKASVRVCGSVSLRGGRPCSSQTEAGAPASTKTHVHRVTRRASAHPCRSKSAVSPHCATIMCMQTHRHVPVVGCEYNVCHHVRLVKEVIPRQLQHRGEGEKASEWAVHRPQQWHPAHLSRSFVGSHGT